MFAESEFKTGMGKLHRVTVTGASMGTFLCSSDSRFHPMHLIQSTSRQC